MLHKFGHSLLLLCCVLITDSRHSNGADNQGHTHEAFVTNAMFSQFWNTTPKMHGT